ncbi:uncharacterized protein [Montipora foliosa]|uniref:uncharacterized protein isoform X3 n=1 Tax=Montipora foliosa TaxID=591990 RepID=UPI0035F1BE61
MSEELFSSLSSTMSSVLQSIDLEQERLTSRPNAVGPLFNSSSPETTSRITTRNAGAKPTRTFVWLGQNVTNVDLSSLDGKRVKFSKGMASDAILTLLKREIPQIGSTSTISFYKSKSAGNHALFYVGSSLSGNEIVSNYKYSTTRVFLARGQEPPENDDVIEEPVTVVSSNVHQIRATDRLITDDSKKCIKGHFGPQYHEAGTTVGLITVDNCDDGLYYPGLLHTSQMQPINAAMRHANVTGLPFVGISFECLCQHINKGPRIGLVFITNQASFLTVEESEMLRDLCNYYVSQRMASDADPLVWISSKDSVEGMMALQDLGGQSLRLPQLMICTPSLRSLRVPMTVEKFTGVFPACEFSDAIEKAMEAIQVVMINRTTKAQEVALKKKQDEEYILSARCDASKQCRAGTNKVSESITTSEIEVQELPAVSSPRDDINKVRLVRARRVLPEDTEGVLIKVHTPIGLLERRFRRNGFYQEVYDWLGSHKDLPLYFVIGCQKQSGLEIYYPRDSVQGGEVLKLIEKDGEVKNIMTHTEVTFSGTFPELPDHNSTVESPGLVKEGIRSEKKKHKQEGTGQDKSKKCTKSSSIRGVMQKTKIKKHKANDAGRGKERKKRVREERADLESRDTRRAKQIKPNVVTDVVREEKEDRKTDNSTSNEQNVGGTKSRRKIRRQKEKERKNHIILN